MSQTIILKTPTRDTFRVVIVQVLVLGVSVTVCSSERSNWQATPSSDDWNSTPSLTTFVFDRPIVPCFGCNLPVSLRIGR